MSYRKLIPLIGIFFFFSSWAIAQSDSNGVIIDLDVNNCNNDGLCQSHYGENFPACPLDCLPDGNSVSPSPHPSSSGNPPFVIFDSEIVPNSLRITLRECQIVLIEWQTYGLAQETLWWGRTADAELGSAGEVGFRQFHSFELLGLPSDTLYYFNVVSIDRYDHRSYLNNQYFITGEREEICSPHIFYPTPTYINPIVPTTPLPEFSEEGSPFPLIDLAERFNWWLLYRADYYVAYFFGFINYLLWLVIHI